jgi:hypothetical protein
MTNVALAIGINFPESKSKEDKLGVELFKNALMPHYPEIEKIEFSRGLYPEFRIKLNDQGWLSDQVAAAILRAAQDASQLLGKYCLDFISPVRELRDSPEHIQLAERLCKSLVEVYEDGVSPRSCERT